MNEKKLKKRVKILSIFVEIIMSIYLLYPHYLGEQNDGGSKIWEAKLYAVVHWNKLPIYDEEKDVWIPSEPTGWKIYIWPNNNDWKTK